MLLCTLLPLHNSEGLNRWRSKVKLAGGDSIPEVLQALEAAAADVVDMRNPDYEVGSDTVTVYWDQEFKFDGSDGLGADAMAGRTVIGLTGIVEGQCDSWRAWCRTL